jgi:hypothetical protein
VDASFVFPQWTLWTEWMLRGDREGIELNLGAWNRYAVDVQQDGAGRLYPAGILHLAGDFAWAEEQLAALSRGRVKIALMTPDLVNGKRLSHPDNDRIWRLFLEYGITPVWHINTSKSVVGSNDPLRTYENMAHVRGTPIEESLYGGNAAEILGLGA